MKDASSKSLKKITLNSLFFLLVSSPVYATGNRDLSSMVDNVGGVLPSLREVLLGGCAIIGCVMVAYCLYGLWRTGNSQEKKGEKVAGLIIGFCLASLGAVLVAGSVQVFGADETAEAMQLITK